MFRQDKGLLLGHEQYCLWGVKPCVNILPPPFFLAFFNAYAFVRGPRLDFAKSPPRLIELTLEVLTTRTITVLGSFENEE